MDILEKMKMAKEILTTIKPVTDEILVVLAEGMEEGEKRIRVLEKRYPSLEVWTKRLEKGTAVMDEVLDLVSAKKTLEGKYIEVER
ncbi:MAG: hypothetical protein E7294_01140 [Lachnospiraceae bacterium]|nr:hypothetical protein [Lachnospiraceae bacterium]